MSYRNSFYFLLASLLFIASTPDASAQSEGMSSTPEAEFAESVKPQFSMVAVGDHPTGYFDDIELSPGESVELTVAIKNTGSIPLKLRTFKVNALSSTNGGFVAGGEGDTPVGSSSWVDYPAAEFNLTSGAQKLVQFTVKAPDDAAPGQYISGLMVAMSDPTPIEGSKTFDQVIGYAISVGILVPGERVYSFELGEPVFEGEWIRIPIENTGNYLVRPTGEFILKDAQGEVVATHPVQLGSIYAGLSTSVVLPVSTELASGEYSFSFELMDDTSGVATEITNATLVIEEESESTDISIISVEIDPNADQIVFADVGIVLHNEGHRIPAGSVELHVFRDGERVDHLLLASNQVLMHGDNTITTRYIPPDLWVTGTYTFQLTVSEMGLSGGQTTILLDEDLDATISVP